jgi:hypothetical protein
MQLKPITNKVVCLILKYFLLEAKQYMNNQVRDIQAGSDVPPV